MYYFFNDRFELQDAGYTQRGYQKFVHWSEEYSPQWAFLGEGRQNINKLIYISAIEEDVSEKNND